MFLGRELFLELQRNFCFKKRVSTTTLDLQLVFAFKKLIFISVIIKDLSLYTYIYILFTLITLRISEISVHNKEKERKGTHITT